MIRFTRPIAFVFLVLLLGACAHTAGSAPSAPSPSPVIDRIQARGELIVGTAGSMPPLNMTTKAGEVIGLEADLARIIAKGMGVELSVKTMPFADLLPALGAGAVDMVLSDVTITPSRNLKFAFVGPYFISGKSILTKKATLANIEKSAELNSPGVTLTALKGSTSQTFVEALLPNAALVLATDYAEAVALVLEDKADAMVADYPICQVSVARYREHRLTALKKPLTYEPIGVALPPNDPLLANWMRNLIGRLQASGELEDLTERWFKETGWLRELP